MSVTHAVRGEAGAAGSDRVPTCVPLLKVRPTRPYPNSMPDNVDNSMPNNSESDMLILLTLPTGYDNVLHDTLSQKTPNYNILCHFAS